MLKGPIGPLNGFAQYDYLGRRRRWAEQRGRVTVTVGDHTETLEDRADVAEAVFQGAITDLQAGQVPSLEVLQQTARP